MSNSYYPVNSLSVLELAGFRNYIQPFCLRTLTPWTIIIGANATGKTNLLEALYFLCRLRGFYDAAWTKLKHWQADSGYIRAKLNNHDAEVCWREGAVEQRLDGDLVVSRRRWACQFPIFGYRPDDDLFFHEQPRLRRAYLDWLCAYLNPSYMDLVANYERTLKQRNAALRNNHYRNNEQQSWEAILAEFGAELTKARAQAMLLLSATYRQLWQKLDREPAQISYIAGGSADVALTVQRLALDRISDRERGWTAFGPHRDDLLVERQGRPIRDSGSQGYRKLAVALLSAAASLTALSGGRRALFYLDDIEGELDDENERRLFAVLAELPLQVFVTAVRRPPVLRGAISDERLTWLELG